MTIESIDNIEVAYELGKLHNIEMPIVEAVYGILYKGLKPDEAVDMLMNRARKDENQKNTENFRIEINKLLKI